MVFRRRRWCFRREVMSTMLRDMLLMRLVMRCMMPLLLEIRCGMMYSERFQTLPQTI